MKNSIVCCLLVMPILAMDVADDEEDMRLEICALGDNQERVGTIIPKRLAISCEVIKSEMDLRELEKGSKSQFPKLQKVYVKPEFATKSLWKKLKPCIVAAQDSSGAKLNIAVQEHLKTPQDLALVLRASNYFGHQRLFDECIVEWADRDYAYAKIYGFPQEIEGAIARQILRKHNLINKWISLTLEKTFVDVKIFPVKDNSPVWSCAIGKGKCVAAGRADGDIYYWTRGKRRWKLHVIKNAHDEKEVGRLQFIENDTKLISSGNDAGVKVWDVATGNCIKSFGSAECNGFFFAYDEKQDLLAISTKEHCINLYQLKSNESGLKAQFFGHGSNINALSFSPDTKLLASIADDRRLSVWDTAIGRLVHAVDLENIPLAVQFDSSGSYIAIGMRNGDINLYHVQDCHLMSVKGKAHNKAIWGCCFSKDNSLLFTASDDRKIKVWAVPELECLRELEGDIAPILFMDSNFDCNRLLMAHGNGNLGLVNIASLIKKIKKEQMFFKYRLRISRAKFLVQAALATEENPFYCTGENGKIFNSLKKEVKALFLKNFHLVVSKESIQAAGEKKGGPKSGK